MATIQTYSQLIATFVTNSIKSISGVASGNIVESFAARMAIATYGFPTALTINTLAGVPQLIPLAGAFFYPPSNFSIVSGAVQLGETGQYEVVYKLNCTPATNADITISLWRDTGSGFSEQPLSGHTDEPSAGKSITLNDNYELDATVVNTKVALYVVTVADEVLNLSQAYVRIKKTNVVKYT